MEKFIASGEKVLTRVSLSLEGRKFMMESIYSDDNTIEMLFQCLEGYVSSQGMNAEDLAKLMRDFLNSKKLPYNPKSECRGGSVVVVIEQYDHRYIFEKDVILNDIEAALSAIFSCAVQSSFLRESVVSTFEGYIEEHTDFDDEIENDEEE